MSILRKGCEFTMNVILVDDEPLILAHQEKIVGSLEAIHTVKTFSQVTSALEEVRATSPEVIFIDIEMPGKNGIELAKELRQLSPASEIVFVTAYTEYALESYDIDALDYLIKPLTHERLEETIQKFKRRQSLKYGFSKGRIRLFDTLEFESSSGESLPVKWRTSKAKELFSYLLHNRDRVISKEALLEEFWGGHSFEKRIDQLYATIYQIRKTLRTLPLQVDLVNYQDGYLLQVRGPLLDTIEFDHGIRSIKILTSTSAPVLRHFLELYRGDYLRDVTAIWVENERERLRSCWLKEMRKLAAYYESQDQSIESIALHLTIQDKCPYEEETYFQLMKLYAMRRDREAVEKQYDRLINMLEDEYGNKPDDSVVNWFYDWKEMQS